MQHPELREADQLIRDLEGQLRRQLAADRSGRIDLTAAVRNWTTRFLEAAPALGDQANEIALALRDVESSSPGARSTAISTAMILLARLRSRAAGTAAPPVLPNTSGLPSEPARGTTTTERQTSIGESVGDPVAQLTVGRGAPRPTVSRSVASAGASAFQPNTSNTALAPLLPVATAKPSVQQSRRVSAPKAAQRAAAPRLTASKPKTDGAGKRSAAPKPRSLDSPIEELPAFKKPYASALSKLNIAEIGDMLRHYPRKYLDYSKLLPINQIRPGEEVTVEVFVLHCEAVGPYRGRGQRVEATFTDTTGSVRAIWFGQPWRAKQLKPGMHLYLSGRVEAFAGRLQFSHPDYEEVTEKESVNTGRLVPVYKLSGEMPGTWLRGRMKWVVDELAHRVEDPLPDAFRRRWNLPPLHAAIQQIHFPDDFEELKIAQRRIAFDDLFLLQLGLQKQRQEWQALHAVPFTLAPERLREFTDRLPFQLTDAQRQALTETLTDLSRDRPMGRLLQGDVGSGKTVVAALAALAAVENGCQAAIIAPTEILAEQHARTLGALFAEMMPMLKPVLITGSLGTKARTDAWKLVGSGQAQVVVGTHALFSAKGEFARLAFVVIDEQHRFGVYQRDTLWRKGERPHLLAMTATPIPRTLALQMFGDLDLSVIDTLPAGRRPIQTRYVAPEKREAVYEFVRAQVAQGRQAYIICPLVDESDALGVKAVTTEFERLKRDIFPSLQLGLVHGRLRPQDKDAGMRRFRDGETQILVATTVIEVGVDVPNATVMVIEGAERFGLAQLHQLRGRVGRGAHQSYCVLIASDEVNEEGEERLHLVEKLADGFALAEADLKLRRTGTFFGDAQSGKERLLRWVEFADPGEARRAAEDLLELDPTLAKPEHARLARQVAEILGKPDIANGDGETASLAYV